MNNQRGISFNTPFVNMMMMNITGMILITIMTLRRKLTIACGVV